MDTTGRILVDDGLFLDGVNVHLRIDDTAPWLRWRGSFTHKDAWSIIRKGSSYTLELEDGRSGEFVVSNIGGSATIQPTVFFVGSEPLE